MHLMVTGRHFKVSNETGEIHMPEAYAEVKGLLHLMVWCLQTEPKERPECSQNLEEGVFESICTLQMARDRLFEDGGAAEEKGWNRSELE